MSQLRATPTAALIVLCLTGCVERLQHDLSEPDANEIMVLLGEHDIAAKKLREEGGNEPVYVISVPKQDYARSAKLLSDYSLPRPKLGGFGDFRKGKGLIPTQTEERAMFLEAVGGEIASALNKIEGVLESRVIVVIPEMTDFTQPDMKPKPSASVFIKYRPSPTGTPPIEEAQVRAFVSTAVEQMEPKFVTVILSPAGSLASAASIEANWKDVLGLRMKPESASTFRLVMAGVGLLVLALAGLAAWLLLRPSGLSRPVPRRSSNTSSGA